MGRNNQDFDESRNSRLSDDSSCEQGSCKEPATKFSWKNGNFCTDCWDNQNGRSGA